MSDSVTQKPEIPSAFELLDELIVKGRLDQKEQEALRFTAVLQISAHAMQRPGLDPKDHRLLALLLARWGYALTDMEQSVSDVADAFEVPTASLARTLDTSIGIVEASLTRLQETGLITVRSGSGDFHAIDLVPVLTELGDCLAQTLYREFLEREGYELAETARFYLESIGDDVDELAQDRPSDPRVRLLASEYEGFRARASVGEFVARWLDEPKTIYGWFTDLAAFEERQAILSGRPSAGLQTELASRAGKKILILGRELAPPEAPANAA